jgi:hypothetical protein
MKGRQVAPMNNLNNFFKSIKDKQLKRDLGVETFDLFDPETKEKVTVEATCVGGYEFKALCPKHDDTSPSLSINLEKKVFYCHGCGFKGALWDDKSQPSEGFKDIVATYDYCNTHGDLLFQTVRLSAPPPKNKTFKQRRPDGTGGWVWNLDSVTLVPYRLPELIKGDDPVFICEGEKDVDNLRALGLTVTTSPMGAGKWRAIFNSYFGGREVVILPDNDEPGRKHSIQVAQSLQDIAKSIKIVELPDLPERGDVSDFLIKFPGITKEQFLEMSSLFEEWTDKPTEVLKWGNGKSLIEILDLPIIPPNYLVEPILAAGDKGFLVAQYKKGKTLLLMDCALSLSMGREWLGFKVPKPRKVLYIRFELKDQRFNQRLHQMVDGMGGKELVQAMPIFEYPRGFEITKQSDFDWLKRMIDTHAPAALFLDPFYKVTSVLDIKDPKNAMPLLRIFEELRSAYPDLLIWLTHHDKKLALGQEANWDNAYGPMFYYADMDFEIKLTKSSGEKFSLSFLSNDVPVEDIKIERDPVTLVHKFAGTASQDLRKEVMAILTEEGLLPKSSSIEGVATIATVLISKKVKFSLDKLDDELSTGVKEGLYKMAKIAVTRSDGKSYKVTAYELSC